MKNSINIVYLQRYIVSLLFNKPYMCVCIFSEWSIIQLISIPNSSSFVFFIRMLLCSILGISEHH